MLRSIGIASALLLTLSGISGADWLLVGDPDIGLADMTSGGKPTTLTIRELSDISDYAFDGSDLEIPFTLDGTGATVYLVIYTVDQHPPLTIEGEGPEPYRIMIPSTRRPAGMCLRMSIGWSTSPTVCA